MRHCVTCGSALRYCPVGDHYLAEWELIPWDGPTICIECLERQEANLERSLHDDPPEC